MNTEDGLIAAYILDGSGGGKQLNWSGITAWRSDQGPLWVHLDRTSPHAERWLAREAQLDPIVIEALLAEETRPRSVFLGEGLLVMLRGVNLNPGATPEDMISVRLWVEAHRVLSLRARRLMAINDIRQNLGTGDGPTTPGELLTLLADRLIDRMQPILEGLKEEVDTLEEQTTEHHNQEVQGPPGEARRRIITLRRYIAPQREALVRLATEKAPWLTEDDRSRLREVANNVTRYVEDLDAAREQATVIQDELTNSLTHQMNRTMYVLSLVAALFLPLGFLTGLLGINVGGIPGLQIYAFDADTGQFIRKTDLSFGRAQYNMYKLLLFINYTSSDLEDYDGGTFLTRRELSCN